MRGILFDLPAVIEQARELVAEAGLADRIELVLSFASSLPLQN